MSRVNGFLVSGILFIILITGLMVTYVGQAQSCDRVFTWHGVVMAFIVTTVPFLLGYFARDFGDPVIVWDNLGFRE